jgi:protocatechuate 3,4-dioxygenase beta subunit
VKFWAGRNHEHDNQSPDPQKIWNFNWGQKEPYKNVGGCALAPESIYGPFWLDGQPRRQDIRGRQQGVYLRLALQVIDVSTCLPVSNARVDAWQCNARGDYNTVNTGDLRGWQPSSLFGTVDFDTIFPGHYPGRATHIHVAVRPEGKNIVHSGQIFFEDALRERVEVPFRLTCKI